MQVQKKLLSSLIMLIVVSQVNNQLVYTQLPGTQNFDILTPQVNIPVNLGKDFTSTKQYSVWGWFKPDVKFPMITNIMTLRNVQGSDAFIKRALQQNLPNCPFSKEQLAQDINLKQQEAVINNPNCDYDTVNNGRFEDLLFVNYDLQPVQNEQQKFSVVFIVQQGILSQTDKEIVSNMRIEGFQDLTRSNAWIFFAISADYVNSKLTYYVKSFDNTNTPKISTININYPQFSLNKNAILTIAGVDRNPYFNTVAGFVGTISNIEFARYYSDQLSYMWAGYANTSSRRYNSILVDLIFDTYDRNEKVKNYGFLQGSYDVNGNYQPIFLQDKNKIGGQFYSNSQIQLQDVDFTANGSDIKSAAFLFFLNYTESLPSPFVLLTRGVEGENGYLEIALEKQGNGRVVKMTAYGSDNKKLNFTGTTIFEAGKNYYFINGITSSLGNDLRTIYIDNQGGNTFDVINENAGFDFGPKNITLFSLNPTTTPASQGFVNLNRFLILDSASPAINFVNRNSNPDIQNQINLLPSDQDKFCQLRSNYYEFDTNRITDPAIVGDRGVCVFCQNSIVDQQRLCQPYCQRGFKNGLNGICVPCLNPNCTELDSTTWQVVPVDSDTYRLIPSRKILTPNLNYNDIININLEGRQNSKDLFDYKLTPNYDTQEVLVDFNWKEELKKETLVFNAQETGNTVLYDANYNRIYNARSTTSLKRVCYVSGYKRKTMEILAYILLLLYCLVIFFMIIFSCLCWNRYNDLGGIWKYLLHHIMKLEMVAFFLLLAIFMPCCVKAFLHQLYKYVVRWDGAIRHWIDNAQKSKDHEWGIHKKLPPQMEYEYVRVFILHNMCITFIIHCAVLVAYLLVKIWDCFLTTKRSWMFRWLNWMEYTILLVAFFLFHMRIFVFSTFNWRKSEWETAYFVICFVISVLYIMIFLIFWFYALIRLIGPTSFWIGNNNPNKFYFFFAGYHNTKYARTFDLWVILAHFVVGLMIGLLCEEPLVQMIVILSVLLVLLAITVLLRPWKNWYLLIGDIITQIAILVPVFIWFIYAILDKSNCEECGDREGKICWVIVLFFFIGLILGLIPLLFATLFGYCRRDQVSYKEENIYHTSEWKNASYQMVDDRYVEGQQNRMVSERVVEENVQNKQLGYTDEMQFKNQQNMAYGERYEGIGEEKNIVSQNVIQESSMREANMVAPDDADEGSVQNQIIDVLAHENEQGKTMNEDKNMLQGRSRMISRKKEEFYNLTSDRNMDVLQQKKFGDNVFSDDVVDEQVIRKKIVTESFQKK